MSKTLQRDTFLRRVAGNYETEVHGDVVLMSVEYGSCYGLDAVGSAIWKRLEQPATVGAIQKDCRAQYDGDAEQIDGDVVQLLESMVAQHLLEVLTP